MKWNHPMNALILVVVAIAILFVLIPPRSNELHSDRIQITASTYVLEHFASIVGKGVLDNISVAPTGADSHSFEPTPRDLTNIFGSDVFVMFGAGLDPWAEAIAEDLEDQGVVVIEMASVFGLESEHDEDHIHEGEDPHVWLDPLHAIEEVRAIEAILIEVDPANADVYQSNAATYIAELEQLHQDIVASLSTCELDTFILAHDAFSHFAERYGLTSIAIAGLSPDEEPSPARLAEIAEIAQDAGVEVIFFETLTSPRLSETLAREINADTDVLNPIEGLTPAELESGETYISLMEQNFTNLEMALRCR